MILLKINGDKLTKALRKLSRNKLSRLQNEYLQGFASQSSLARKYGISRCRLWQIAKDNDWLYGGERHELLEKFNEISKLRLNNQRVDAVEEHALELSSIRDMLKDISDLKEAELLSCKADVLLKCIKGERTAYGLPNDFRQLETRSEVNVRSRTCSKHSKQRRPSLRPTPYPHPPSKWGQGRMTRLRINNRIPALSPPQCLFTNRTLIVSTSLGR